MKPEIQKALREQTKDIPRESVKTKPAPKAAPAAKTTAKTKE